LSIHTYIPPGLITTSTLRKDSERAYCLLLLLLLLLEI